MNCPGFEKLIDYLDGHLSGALAEAVAAHLVSGCAQCAADRDWYERVSVIAASDDSIEPPPWVLKRAVKLFETASRPSRFTERVSRIVASLIFDSLAGSALSGVRLTASADHQMLFRAGSFSIDLQIVSTGQQTAELSGQILKEGEFKFESVAGLEIALSGSEEGIRSTFTNDLGEFAFSSIESGSYDLQIETRETSVMIENLPIG